MANSNEGLDNPTARRRFGPIGLDRLEVFAEGLDHSEGIAVAPDGTLYVGGEAGQIYRIEHDQPVVIANTGGFILGLATDADGRVFAIDSANHCVWCIEPEAGSMFTYATGSYNRRFEVPNWGAFDSRGNYFLTDSGSWGSSDGVIWLVRPGGESEIWTHEASDFPNGCAVSPDEKTLYFVESYPGRICAIPIEENLRPGKRVVLHEMGWDVPDGVAIADDGSLVVSCYRPDVIYRWQAGGGLEVLASDPRGTILAAPTNVAFVGRDRETLVVPNLGRWHLTRGDLGVRGAPLHYPARLDIDGKSHHT